MRLGLYKKPSVLTLHAFDSAVSSTSLVLIKTHDTYCLNSRMTPCSFKKHWNLLYLGNSSARMHRAKNSARKPLQYSAPRSVISLKCNFPRISAASALPCLRFRQLLFCIIVSEFCCLNAKDWMTHPSHPKNRQPCHRSDCFPCPEKTKKIHSKTRDHLPQLRTDQAWAAVVAMAP